MNLLRDTLLDFVNTNTPDIYFKPCKIYPVTDSSSSLFSVVEKTVTTRIDVKLGDSLHRLNNVATSLRANDILLEDGLGMVYTNSGKWNDISDLYAIPIRFIPFELVDCLEQNDIFLRNCF